MLTEENDLNGSHILIQSGWSTITNTMRKFWRWKAIWIGHYIHGIFYIQWDFLDHTMWKCQWLSEGWHSGDHHEFFVFLFFLTFGSFISYFFVYSLAALYFHCYTQLYASCGQWGYPLLWCVGFSSQWVLLLWCTGLSSCGTWA